MGSILAFIGGLATMFLLSMYRGLMLSTFWGWFVMPVFKSVPSIGIAAACGISLLMSALTHQTIKTGYTHTFSESLMIGFLSTTMFFAVGWVITWFL